MISKAPGQADGSIDALYVTADQPHQLSLYAEPEVDYGLVLQKKIDAVYVTRFQKERWTEKERPYPKIDAKFLGEAKYSQASVMHPLPRVNELDASLDSDRRAIYFRQAAYGVPVRMALISLLLHLHRNKSLHKFAGGFAKPDHPLHVQPIGSGIQCVNANCITRDPGRTPIRRQQILRRGRELRRSDAGCAAFIARPISRRTWRSALRRRRHDAKDLYARIGALARAPAEKLKHLIIHSSRSRSGSRGLYAARRRQEGARRVDADATGQCAEQRGEAIAPLREAGARWPAMAPRPENLAKILGVEF